MLQPQHLLSSCGLPAAWAGQPQWRILALGQGAAPAFLVAWAAWRDDLHRPRLLHFIVCSEQPPQAQDLPPDSPLAQQLAAQLWGLLPGVHRLSFEGGRVLLTLHVGDVQALLRQQQPTADTVWLADDADWNPHTLKAVARCCRRGTRLAAPPGLRQPLAACGFTVQDAPPQALLQATFDPSWQPRPSLPPLPPAALPEGAAPGHCLVVGAGLAGSAVAASLARRGWQVTVLDAADAPAAGASGLLAGLFASHISPDDSLLSRLTRSGVRTTLQTLADLLPGTRGTDWDDGGVLEHDAGEPVRLAWSDGPGLDWSRPADAQQLYAAHLPPGAPACWHGRGGWVRPPQLVRALLAQPGIRWRGAARVARLEPGADGLWRALNAQGHALAEGTLAVVCAGPASAAVAGAPVPLQLLRGQIAWGLHSEMPPAAPWPARPVNGHGNLVPHVPVAGSAGWVLGSTFERDCGQLPVSPTDEQAGRAENQAKLGALLPALARALAPAFAAGSTGPVRTWAAVRCAAPDRLPLVGPVHAQALPGLWISTAMGARGLTLALLCAELLAARLHGEPLPLPARLAQALGTERLLPQH